MSVDDMYVFACSDMIFCNFGTQQGNTVDAMHVTSVEGTFKILWLPGMAIDLLKWNLSFLNTGAIELCSLTH